jgi:hypothetical protein
MVAYADAAQFPEATERVVLMDAFLPGIGDWSMSGACVTCGIFTSTATCRWPW